MYFRKIILLVIACLVFIQGVAAADPVFRNVLLENGLRAILISASATPLSAASITVGAGTLCNPRDKQGLAHFVEHLLFQGSKKYPHPGEFQNFIIRNGGYYYAETDLDCTNYGFQVKSGSFDEAFDRFADFFMAPLMAKETIPAELKIIEEEFQKFSASDAYTVATVKARFYKEGHPLKNMLLGGNAKTLKSATHRDAKAYFETYYRPDVITLAVIGSQGLDELEGIVRKAFSSKKRGKPVNIQEYKDFIDEKNTVEVVHIATKSNYKMLYLDFAVESEKDDWKGRPGYLIRTLLESNAAGSLLALLKQEGLATDLKVSTGQNAKANTGTGWTICFTLTDKGFDEYKRVLDMFFAEINLLKGSEFPAELFEKKRIASIEDVEIARTLTGLSLTKPMALSLQSYPAEHLIDLNFIHLMEKNESAYYKVLEQIRPSRMIASLLTPDLKEGITEPYYGTLYTSTRESDDFYNKLMTPGKYEFLHIPKVVFNAEQSEAAPNVAKYTDLPICLSKDAGKSLFLIRSNAFGNKRVSTRIRLSLPDENISLKEAAKLELLVAMINEAMPAWIGQEATLSGTEFSVDSRPHRLIFEISGQSEKVRLTVDLLARFLSSPDRGIFYNAIKSNLVSTYKSYDQQDAYIKAWECYTSIAGNNYWRYRDYIPLIESTTSRDVAAFSKTICAKSKLEAMIYGDVTESAAPQIVEGLARLVSHDGGGGGTHSKYRILKILRDEDLIFWDSHSSSNSGIHIAYHNVGGPSPEDMAASMILGKYIGGVIHTKMCIEDKIAYVAGAYNYSYIDQSHAYIDIQSSRFPADELLSRTDSLLAQLPEMFEHIADDHWRDIVEGIRDELSRGPLSITEATRRSFDSAFERDENWEWNDTLIKAVEKTNKQDVAKLLKETFDKQTRRRVVVVESGDKQASTRYKTIPCSFEELEKWKTNRIYE